MYCSEGVYLGEHLSWDSADQSEYRDVDAGVYVRRQGKAGSCLGVDLVERIEMDPEWKDARSLSLGGVAGDKGSDARTGVEGTARESEREAVGKESGTIVHPGLPLMRVQWSLHQQLHRWLLRQLDQSG